MYGAYYYDSVARPPPPEIATWILRLRDTAPSSTRHFELAYNQDRRQFQNTECGIFAMHFLVTAVENTSASFVDICKSMGYDRDMSVLRHAMFRDVRTSPRSARF